jgi:hypothetical protein
MVIDKPALEAGERFAVEQFDHLGWFDRRGRLGTRCPNGDRGRENGSGNGSETMHHGLL